MMTDFEAVLDAVGSWLRAHRRRSGLTLAAVSEITGIPDSTLSRLESGKRSPGLELLLPLARAYNVPLDDLVGAPASGDPRVRNGRVAIRDDEVCGFGAESLGGARGGCAWSAYQLGAPGADRHRHESSLAEGDAVASSSPENEDLGGGETNAMGVSIPLGRWADPA